MASKIFAWCLGLILLGMLSSGTNAQSSSSSCTSQLMSMSSCLNYITGNTSTPASQCCSGLASVVQTSPQCLCTALNSGSSLGITVNQTQALKLPAACNVQTPPVSQCKGAGGTSGTAAAVSPTTDTSDPEAPSPDSSSGSSGSKATPSIDGTASDASITISSLLLTFAVASAAAMF